MCVWLHLSSEFLWSTIKRWFVRVYILMGAHGVAIYLANWATASSLSRHAHAHRDRDGAGGGPANITNSFTTRRARHGICSCCVMRAHDIYIYLCGCMIESLFDRVIQIQTYTDESCVCVCDYVWAGAMRRATAGVGGPNCATNIS